MDVWQISLDHQGGLDALLELLDGEESSRARRFRFEQLSRSFILAHAATRCILSRYTGRCAAELSFVYNDFGKPFLAESDGPVFSLSHSGSIALCSVASAGEIGVDVEMCRNIDNLEMSQRFFTNLECALLNDLAVEQQTEGFFACWTRKEAYIKAKGLGLSLPLDEFSVDPNPNQAAMLLESAFAPADVAGYKMWDIPVPSGYKAALAYCGTENGPPVRQQWNFSAAALATTM